MYRHILVPTDGSELSGNAIEHAVALAKALKAKITVLTVSIPYYAYAVEPDFTTVAIEEYQKASEKIAAQYFDIARNIANASDVPCETVCVENARPYIAIIDMAQARRSNCHGFPWAARGCGGSTRQ